MYDSQRHVRQHLELVNKGDFSYPMSAFDVETDGFYGEIQEMGCWRDGEVQLGFVRFKEMMAAHNGKYDIRVLAEQRRFDGGGPPWMLIDTLAGCALLDENSPKGLKGRVKMYGLNEGIPDEVFNKWYELGWLPNMSREELDVYLTIDIEMTRRLGLYLWPRLKDEGLLTYWLKLQCPLAFITAEMESRGIRIDRAELERRASTTLDCLNGVEYAIRQAYPGGPWACPKEGCIDGTYHWKRGGKVSICPTCNGTGINVKVWNSPKQLEEILFGELGLKSVGETEAGNNSTSHESLLKLRDQGDVTAAIFVHRLMERRKLANLLTTFYKPYLESGGDRLHPNLKPFLPRTGRWSCDSPNLQNIPKAVRSVFIPDEGHAFIKVDYVQLEMYLAGLVYEEPVILEAYKNGENLHRRTAEIAGVDYDRGKTINFSFLYGLVPATLARRLNIGKGESHRIYEEVTGGYSALFDGIERTKAAARRRGYVTTYLGRKRRVPSICSSDFKERIHAENQVVNARIQGTAAELINSALIACKLDIPEAKPLLQVHDEVLFSVPIDDVEEIMPEIVSIFENAIGGLNPKADAEVQERWG